MITNCGFGPFAKESQLLHTRRRVLVIDNLATILITIVGLGVILAVAGMMLFLISSSWPIFKPEKFVRKSSIDLVPNAKSIIFDEIAPLAVVLPRASDNCILHSHFAQNFENPSSSPGHHQASYQLLRKQPTNAETTTNWELSPTQAANANPQQNGFDVASCSADEKGNLLVRVNNTLIKASVQIVREFLAPDELLKLGTEERKKLTENKWAILQDGVYLVKASQQSPAARLKIQVDTSWEILDFFTRFPEANLASLRFLARPGKKDGLILMSHRDTAESSSAKIWLLTSTENNMTGEIVTDLREIALARPIAAKIVDDEFLPVWIEGRHLVLPLNDLSIASIDTEDANLRATQLLPPAGIGPLLSWSPTFGGAALLAEFKLPENENEQVRCAYLDVGRAVRLAASALNESAEIPVLWSDKCSLALKTLTHPHKRIVYRVVKSNSTDQLTIEARELTTGRVAANTNLPSQSFDSIILDTHGQLLAWHRGEQNIFEVHEFVAPHVEVSLKTLFSKIKYESYENASFSWQSTSGSDEFQSKFSLIPLIWGTFKATLYSLLFAVPLAILAAIYSSEILDRQTRNVVKPTLEMMASVPSVVLGFLAAIVIAPWVENHIVSVLLIGTTMPFLLYVFGVFLQVPSARHLTTRGLYASRRLLMWVIAGFTLMLWLLTRAGLLIERTAFGGDLKAFLSGGPGTEGVLWGLLILPLVLVGLWSLPIRRGRNWYRIAVFFIGPLVSVGLGGILAGHTELRSDLLGQYAQRNTLVIAIAMGFAIIPIIYSLAEDALTSVPNSLRAGSLACGASVWQTTARVVLPTAASGLFSAIMVGLGRGIGETMIAVMATGNTAVMTTNPFDGLRSMAANIAVELPEAAQGSTHYRILFLSALTLFMFTFTLNSFAEFLRARYRARNKAL